MKKLLSVLFADFRHAWKSVIFHRKQYLAFFLALFICQSFCWILLISNTTNNAHVYETVRAEYDYHFTVERLSDTERIYLENRMNEANENGAAYVFSVVEEPSGYTIFVTLGEADFPTPSTEWMYDAFLGAVVPEAGLSAENLTIVPSPLLSSYLNYIKSNNLLTVLIAVLLGVISTALLMSLYRVRLNHHKFLYGIYMSFGADFKRLFRTAVTELLLLSAVTLVPSFLFSLGASVLTYVPKGIPVEFPLGQILLFLLFNFLIVFFSVYLPMKHLSLREPVQLIVSQDNSNLVSSPRRSFHIFGKSFPRDYEIYTFIRFRKYFLKLLLTATAFTAAFLCGLYLAGMYGEARDAKVEEYRIVIPEGEDSDEVVYDCGEIVPMINALDGISHCYWNASTSATSMRAFMMMQGQSYAGDYAVRTTEIQNTEENTKAPYERYVESGYTTATDSYEYTFYDKEMIDLLCSSYTVEGDPYAILEGTGNIILSESIFNREIFDFKVGDTVVMAIYAFGGEPIDTEIVDGRFILMQQIEKLAYRFKEYKVCAVVRDDASDHRIIAGVGAEDYQTLTHDEPRPESVSVYVESDISLGRAKGLLKEIRELLDFYADYGYAVESTGAYLSETLTREKYSGVRIVLWSALILLLSPLIWFFSQILFYRKRDREFWILEAFGAFGVDIRGIHLWSGILLGATAAVIALLESLTFMGIVFGIANYLLPSLGILSGVRYVFYIPPFGMVLTVVASLAFGFLSAFLPYRIYRSRNPRNEPTACENYASPGNTSTDAEPEKQEEKTLS